MLEALALNNSIGILICLLSFIKLISVYRRTKNSLVLDFAKFYLFLALFLGFLLIALSEQTIFKSLFILNLPFLLSRFFLFLSVGYFIKVPLEIREKTRLKNFVFRLYVFLAIIMPIMSYLFSRQTTLIENPTGPILVSPEPLFFSIIIGVLVALPSFLTVIFFVIQGLNSQDSINRLKSLMIGCGMAFLLLASIINFILNYVPFFSFSAYVMSSILAWIGLLVILVGILIKKTN